MKRIKTLEIATPEWSVPFFGPARYKGGHGGRGSGKSHFFAEMMVEAHIMDPNTSSVCVREVQKSLAQSVKRLLEQKIEDLGVGHLFDVMESEIRNRNGTGLIIFVGMQNHTADSIKSLEGFDRAWVEEAQSLSQRSLDLLRPTIRKPGSELWFTWNPTSPTDAVDVLLRTGRRPPDSIVIEVNHGDNPWFPAVLRAEMEFDRSNDPEKFEHIWNGRYYVVGGRVYGRFRREYHCAAPWAATPGKGRVAIGCDFNVGNMAWIVAEIDDDRKTAHVVGEVIKEGGTTTDQHAEVTAEWIAAYLTRTRGRRFTREDVFRMRVAAYIDASGKARDSTSTLSDVHLLVQAGFNPIHPKANPPVKDRISTVNTLLRDRRVTFDPACVTLTRGLEMQALDANGNPDKASGHDHALDALGYLLHTQWPVYAPRPNLTAPPSAGRDEWGPLGP
jgi:PBSX family phage terminase large subunit